MVAPLLLTSGPVRCEAELHDCGTSLVCLSYAIATVFQLYQGMNEMRRKKPEPTLLLTQGILSLPHHIDMVWEELGFDDAVSHTQWWKSKLAEMMAWGIELPTFRFGVWLWKKVRPPNHSVMYSLMNIQCISIKDRNWNGAWQVR